MLLAFAPPAHAAKDFNIKNNSQSFMYVSGSSGNVGIGTTTPQGGFVVTNGNVGIGTFAPTEVLHVSSGGDTNIRVEETVSGNKIARILLKNNAGDAATFGLMSSAGTSWPAHSTVIDYNTSGPLVFTEATIEKMRLDVNGNVGIGTTGPRTPLQIIGGNILIDSNYGLYRNYSPSVTRSMIDNPSSGTTRIRPTDNNAADGIRLEDWAGDPTLFVSQGGNVGIGSTAPGAYFDVYNAAPTGGVLSRFVSGNASGYVQIKSTTGSSWQVGTDSTGLKFYNDDNTAYRVTIKNDGNVGIGSTAPGSLLDVTGVSSGARVLTSNGTSTLSVSAANGSTTFILNRSAASPTGFESDMLFQTAGSNDWAIGTVNWNGIANSNFRIDKGDGTTKLEIDTNGNVGIGTTLPQNTFDVAGAARTGSVLVSSYGLYASATGGAMNGIAAFGHTNGSQATTIGFAGMSTFGNYPLSLGFNNTAIVTIATSSNVGIGSTNPGKALDIQGDARVSGAYYGDGSHLTGISGSVSGLTTNYVPKAASATTLTNSLIYDDGTNVGIGAGTSPTHPFHVVTNTASDQYQSVLENLSTGRTRLLVKNSGAQAAYEADVDSNGVVSIQTGKNTYTGTQLNSYSGSFSFNSGNVGIGTTAPAKLLDVDQGTTGATAMRVVNPTSGSANLSTLQHKIDHALKTALNLS